MKFTVITLFPDFIKTLNDFSIIGRALNEKKIELETINLRDFGLGNYKQVDDRPYGGGAGMLIRADVIVPAIRSAQKKARKNTKTILLCPSGNKFTQATVSDFSKLDELIIVSGHYEGFDKRIEKYVDEKISIGDYIVSGGEIPAMAIIDAVSRHVPGVLGNQNSLDEESHSPFLPAGRHGVIRDSLFEYDQYTRPEEFEGTKVPEVLISGDHEKIKAWRKQHWKS